jgi:phage terminase large subunit-like protein
MPPQITRKPQRILNSNREGRQQDGTRMGGKTRTGAGWVHQRALQYPKRWIAIVARTPADARDHMIEGPGGLLRNTHPA